MPVAGPWSVKGCAFLCLFPRHAYPIEGSPSRTGCPPHPIESLTSSQHPPGSGRQGLGCPRNTLLSPPGHLAFVPVFRNRAYSMALVGRTLLKGCSALLALQKVKSLCKSTSNRQRASFAR
ncbi:hypothetical protein LZ31DRAFT_336412 [Colletotrichum somersetense]|nr:hypothetical protein LZ31DRAFT_336412 [Colletotrichum somersetense]